MKLLFTLCLIPCALLGAGVFLCIAWRLLGMGFACADAALDWLASEPWRGRRNRYSKENDRTEL